MGKFIPNENTWVGLSLVCLDIHGPKVSEIDGAVDVTPLITGINASASGNSVPTPSFDTLFETSIPGTSTATFSMDFYRDDESDLAWETCPRGAKLFAFITRFGGKPILADDVEVWPIRVTSRAMANMTNNTAVTFTVNASVPVEPDEAAVVAA
jgi:hypothetical protein